MCSVRKVLACLITSGVKVAIWPNLYNLFISNFWFYGITVGPKRFAHWHWGSKVSKSKNNKVGQVSHPKPKRLIRMSGVLDILYNRSLIAACTCDWGFVLICKGFVAIENGCHQSPHQGRVKVITVNPTLVQWLVSILFWLHQQWLGQRYTPRAWIWRGFICDLIPFLWSFVGGIKVDQTKVERLQQHSCGFHGRLCNHNSSSYVIAPRSLAFKNTTEEKPNRWDLNLVESGTLQTQDHGSWCIVMPPKGVQRSSRLSSSPSDIKRSFAIKRIACINWCCNPTGNVWLIKACNFRMVHAQIFYRYFQGLHSCA